jgi:hypothetical protein
MAEGEWTGRARVGRWRGSWRAGRLAEGGMDRTARGWALIEQDALRDALDAQLQAAVGRQTSASPAAQERRRRELIAALDNGAPASAFISATSSRKRTAISWGTA